MSPGHPTGMALPRRCGPCPRLMIRVSSGRRPSPTVIGSCAAPGPRQFKLPRRQLRALSRSANLPSWQLGKLLARTPRGAWPRVRAATQPGRPAECQLGAVAESVPGLRLTVTLGQPRKAQCSGRACDGDR
eukprot:329962-Hanusia_phi.AAC.1